MPPPAGSNGTRSQTRNIWGISPYMLQFRGTDQFFADADSGRCSRSASWIRFDTYSEENLQAIRNGESFTAKVINRVTHGQGWRRTLVIWVYDEHGGYHDHVAPPAAVPPDEVEERSGVRPPAAVRCCPAASSWPFRASLTC